MKQYIKNCAGFGAIEIILIVAVLAVVGFTGWTFINSSNKAKHAADSSQTSPTPNASASPASMLSSVPAGTVAVTEWGVQGKPTQSVSLKYVISSKNSGNVANFSSSELIEADSTPNCGVDSSLNKGGGLIQRVAPGGTVLGVDNTTIEGFAGNSANQGQYKKVGGYYYVYIRPQSDCSSSTAANQIQHTTWDAMLSFVQSLQLAQ